MGGGERDLLPSGALGCQAFCDGACPTAKDSFGEGVGEAALLVFVFVAFPPPPLADTPDPCNPFSRVHRP